MTEVVGCKCGCAEMSSEWDKNYGQFYSYIHCDKCDYYWEGYTAFELKEPTKDSINLEDTYEDIEEYSEFENFTLDKNTLKEAGMEKGYYREIRIENMVHYYRLEELENPADKLNETIRYSIAVDSINKFYSDKLTALGYVADKSVSKEPVLELSMN